MNLKMNSKMKKIDRKGQSSIEFVIIFSFSIGFLILFLSLAINMTLGYLVHYATFEASRVYLVKDQASQVVDTSESWAMKEVESMKAINNLSWTQIFKNRQFKMEGASGFKFNRPGQVISEFVGVYFSYKRRLSDYSLLTGNEKVEYVSESFLGKEPVRSECLERICSKMKGSCTSQVEVTAFDNGC